MLTETKEINKEVGKMGKFGILPGYEIMWSVNQMKKKMIVYVFIKKKNYLNRRTYK